MNKRLILFMTSFALAATPISAFASEYTDAAATIEAVEGRASLKAATGEYTSWLQYDSRWGSMLMGGCDTMSESGCLVTAIAMLMVHSGAADENGVNPGKLCTYLNNNNGFTSSSELIWGKVSGAVSGFSLANWKVSLSGSRYDKAAQIKRYLDQGYYVVVNVGHGAHWVAVNYADDNGNVYIFDPAYPYTSLFDSYSASGVVSIATFTSTGNGNGNISAGESDVKDYTATGKVNVGTSYLNVRSGVGTSYGYLKDSNGKQVTLSDGAEVKITGKGTDSSGAVWYRISINGLTGYVYGAYIDVTASGSTSTTEGKSAKVTGNYVNIRSGAGTSYSSVGGAPQNAAITVYETKTDSQGNTWYKVKYGNITGYMIAEYIQLDDEAKIDETLYSTSKPGKVNAELLRVRKGPGTSYDTVTNIALNTAVTLLGEVTDSTGTKWYKLKYSGGEGYAMAEYITITTDNTQSGTTYESKNGVVNDDYVNVRSGAGTNYSAKTSLRKDTAVTITGEAKDGSGATWYKIKYSGGEGYIRSDFVTIRQSNSNTNNGSSYVQKTGKVNDNSVNVRSGAGTSNSIVGNISSPTAVTITGEAKDGSGNVWYKITYSGGSGYIRSDFVTLDGSSSNSSDTTYTEKAGAVNANGVNVRKGAGTNNSVITALYTGASVTITGETKDSSGATWYKIKYSGGEGYIHASYVTVTNGSSSTVTPTPTPSYEQKNGKVNDDYVYVRSGAGTNYNYKVCLRVNTAVTITGEAKDTSGTTWYKVKYSGGEGYMHSSYVTIVTDTSSSDSGNSSGNSSSSVPTEGVAGKEGIVNQAQVNVRKSADSNAEVLDVLEKDVSVLIQSASKDSSGIVWYKVSYAGTSGYMQGQYVTVQ